MKASIKNIVLPDAPEPTRAAYKKPVLYNNSKHMRVVEIPSVYNPKPIPAISQEEKEKRKKRKRGFKREVSQPPRFWTRERDKELARLYEANVTIEEIGRMFGKNKGAISDEVHRLIDAGMIKARRPVNAWPQEDLDLMYEMRMQGKTFGEIADRLGRSYKSCAEQFRRIYG